MRIQLDRPGVFTFQDLWLRCPDDQKADLINGVLYVASPGTPHECDRIFSITKVLSDLVEESELGSVFTQRVVFRLDNRNGPEPDIAFVGKRHAPRRRREYVNGPPDLVIEDVTPDSVYRDYVLKRQLYQRYCVPEYWLNDADRREVTLFRLTSGKCYRLVKASRNVLRSTVVPGSSLIARW